MPRANRRPYRLGIREVSMQETRRRIIDALIGLLAESGYHGISIEEMARAAGVSRQTVYKHFDSKAAVLTALQEEMVRRGGIDRVREARMHPDPLEALRGFIRENCRMFATMLPAMRVGLAAAWTDDDVRKLSDATYRGGRRASITELVGRLSKEIGLAPGWTPARAVDALMVLTGFEALETLVSAQGRSTEKAAATLFDLARAMLVAPERRRARSRRPR